MQSVLLKELRIKNEHGGSISRGKRKVSRPLSTKRPLHLVLKSDVAIGRLSLVRFETTILKILEVYAKKFQIKVYKISINRNHLHLCILGTDRRGLTSFFRAFSGVVAKQIIRQSQTRVKKLWTYRIYSRIVAWGQAFKIVLAYIEQNTLETAVLIPFKPRKKRKLPYG